MTNKFDFNQMMGETYSEKYNYFLKFVIKLNSIIQYGLAELIASNNATIKTDKDESIV